jgi:hypothetical protein
MNSFLLQFKGEFVMRKIQLTGVDEVNVEKLINSHSNTRAFPSNFHHHICNFSVHYYGTFENIFHNFTIHLFFCT